MACAVKRMFLKENAFCTEAVVVLGGRVCQGGFPVPCRDRVSRIGVLRNRLKSCSDTNFAVLAFHHPSSLLLFLRFWDGWYDRCGGSSVWR
jgi:hypothetical protein